MHRQLLLISTLLLSSSIFAFDHSKVIGPTACMSCHSEPARIWKTSAHQKNFRKFHKSKRAKKIAKRLGIKRIKKSNLCMTCHYTHNGRKKIISGVSCESCHGPARDWINIHNNIDMPNRISKIEKAGMHHPGDLYGLAKNCMSCHFMQKEELVEVGKHLQKDDFEFVSWTQGMIRHNFNRSLDGGNAPSSPKRRRLMYIIGRVVDLEQGLRGVAEVTKRTDFAINIAKRTKKALGHLDLIVKEVPIPEIREILIWGRAEQLKPNNKEALISLANKISRKMALFQKKKNHGDLSKIDKLIPKFTKGEASK